MFTLKELRESDLYKHNWPKAKAVHGIKAGEFLRELHREFIDAQWRGDRVALQGTIAHLLNSDLYYMPQWSSSLKGEHWWGRIAEYQGSTSSRKISPKKRELRILI